MKYKLLSALGILVAIAGATPSVYAQPKVASNSETGRMTLSGNSLVGLENRTVQQDFNRFFLGNSSSLALGNTENTNSAIAQPRVVGEITDTTNTDIVVSEPLTTSNPAVPIRQNFPYEGFDRVQVQLAD
ncbi:MAG TPA: hypothetical protein V6C85_26010 [Allocoleopsis sp.]